MWHVKLAVAAGRRVHKHHNGDAIRMIAGYEPRTFGGIVSCDLDQVGGFVDGALDLIMEGLVLG